MRCNEVYICTYAEALNLILSSTACDKGISIEVVVLGALTTTTSINKTKSQGRGE